jgi:uncharacterized OsmC-like protein
LKRTTPPRRIDQLNIELHMPIAADHPLAEKLIQTAQMCPVHLSLHPDIHENIIWHWAA